MMEPSQRGNHLRNATIYLAVVYIKNHEMTHIAQNIKNLKDKLEKHERTHTGEKPFAWSKCDQSFSRNFFFRTHEMTHIDQIIRK